MGVNHITFGGNELINLMSDTVTAETLEEGITAHGADGEIITGAGLPGRVRFDTAQSLTETEQAQARENIGITQNYVTPQMYGAKGDGVTDDTAAFISAITENDNVYVPAGTYVISSTLDLTQGKRLYSDAGQRAVLRFSGTTGDVVLLGRYSKFQNIDIHIPNVLSGNVFNTDNRLYGTSASFLYTTVSSCDITIDNECSNLTLINIVASNDDSCQGFCYQTYRDINALAPDYVDSYTHSKWGRYATGIKMTLSADSTSTTDLSWITHLNFEDIFLGSPITAIKAGVENNSEIESPAVISLIDHVMLTNVSSQIAVGYSQKFYDIEYCGIRAINCIAWDYQAYITKYNTFGSDAHLLLQHGEMPPIDATEFINETLEEDSQYWDDFPYFINKYFSQIPTLTTGLEANGRNDPRFATKITSVTDGANINEIASADGGSRTPEVITPSVYRIAGKINVGTTSAPIEKQGVGLQINAGTYWGWGGTASKRIIFTTSGECFMSQYADSSKAWSNWVKIFTENNLEDIFTGINDDVNSLISAALDEAEESGRFSDKEIIAQYPVIVDSVEEMTDPNEVYVLKSTGHIWEYSGEVIEQEITVTDKIVGTSENDYIAGSRLTSSTTDDTFTNDVTQCHITPLIDLTKSEYQGKTIQLHLEGAQYASTGTYTGFVQCRIYGTDKTILAARPYVVDVSAGGAGLIEIVNNTISVLYKSNTEATLDITIPPKFGSTNTTIGYIRFCGIGAIEDSNIYITYSSTEVVSGNQWIDTEMIYAVPEIDLSGYQPKGDYALNSDIPTKISQLTNDEGFITGYTETDPTVPAWAKAATKPSYTASEVGLSIETWTFTLADGSTVTKKVAVSS